MVKYLLIILLFVSCTTKPPADNIPAWDMDVYPMYPEMSDVTLDDIYIGDSMPSDERIIYPSRIHDSIPEDTADTIYIIKDCFQPFPDDEPDTNIDVDSYMLRKGEFYLGPSVNDQMILSIRYDTLMLYTPLKIHYIKVDGALYKITLVSDFYQRIDADSTKEWYSLPSTIDNFKIK